MIWNCPWLLAYTPAKDAESVSAPHSFNFCRCVRSYPVQSSVPPSSIARLLKTLISQSYRSQQSINQTYMRLWMCVQIRSLLLPTLGCLQVGVLLMKQSAPRRWANIAEMRVIPSLSHVFQGGCCKARRSHIREDSRDGIWDGNGHGGESVRRHPHECIVALKIVTLVSSGSPSCQRSR